MARRFQAKQSTISNELRSVIDKMSATGLRVSQDLFTGAAEIVFDRNGKRYVFRCDQYEHHMDNLRAAQLTISYLWRALEEYGVARSEEQLEQMFDQFFLGFTPAPDDSVLLLPDRSRAQWWEVLGVPSDADAVAIRNAYRALARIHHPDVGGNAEEFKRLRAAYKQGIEGVQS